MDSRSAGVLIIGIGLVIAVVGVLAMTGWLGWFGRLPGDLRIERENVRVYVPIVSMLIVSVVLSLLIALLRRWF